MKFAPEYVTHVLNENFEDAKELLLSPLMAINYEHLVMLAEQGIVSAADARALRDALDGISLDRVRATASADLGFAAELLYAVPLKVDVAKIANADFRIRSVRDDLARADGVAAATGSAV